MLSCRVGTSNPSASHFHSINIVSSNNHQSKAWPLGNSFSMQLTSSICNTLASAVIMNDQALNFAIHLLYPGCYNLLKPFLNLFDKKHSCRYSKEGATARAMNHEPWTILLTAERRTPLPAPPMRRSESYWPGTIIHMSSHALKAYGCTSL